MVYASEKYKPKSHIARHPTRKPEPPQITPPMAVAQRQKDPSSLANPPPQPPHQPHPRQEGFDEYYLALK